MKDYKLISECLMRETKAQTCNGCPCYDSAQDCREVFEEGAKAIETLYIAKRPITDKGTEYVPGTRLITPCTCPSCGEYVYRHNKHCSDCGQLLGWV